MPSSCAAIVTAVGNPLATSVAKLGPERTAGIASGISSRSTSLRKRLLARSIPLAQMTQGTPARAKERAARTTSRKVCAGTTASMRSASARRAISDTGFRTEAAERAANASVRRNAAGSDERIRMAIGFAEDTQRSTRAVDDHVDDGCLKRGAQVRDIGARQRRDAFGFEPHRRLQSRQGEVRLWPHQHRPRQIETLWVAVDRLALDIRSTGIG